MKQNWKNVLFWTIVGGISLIPLYLNLPHKGSPMLHFNMEIVAAFLALSIAITAFSGALEGREGLSAYLGAAFLTAGLSDFFHAIFPMGILFLPGARISGFIPGNWTAGRCVLGLLLIIGLINTGRDARHRPVITKLATTSAISLLLCVIFFDVLHIPDRIIESIPSLFLYQPWEFLPLIFFAVVFWLCVKETDETRTEYCGILMPSLALGILTQLVMSMAAQYFNFAFDAAHILKVISYLAFLLPLWFYVQKRSRFSLPVATSRFLSLVSILLMTVSLISVVSMTFERNITKQMNIDSMQERTLEHVKSSFLKVIHSVDEYFIFGDKKFVHDLDTTLEETEKIFHSQIYLQLERDHNISLIPTFKKVKEHALKTLTYKNPNKDHAARDE
ncbi:MASE3 domain-containing protein, partial [Candidatus Riflebacteria bacterium]